MTDTETPTTPTPSPAPYTVTQGCACYTCDKATWEPNGKNYQRTFLCPTCNTSLCHGAVRHDRHGLTAEQWHAIATNTTPS